MNISCAGFSTSCCSLFGERYLGTYTWDTPFVEHPTYLNITSETHLPIFLFFIVLLESSSFVYFSRAALRSSRTFPSRKRRHFTDVTAQTVIDWRWRRHWRSLDVCPILYFESVFCKCVNPLLPFIDNKWKCAAFYFTTFFRPLVTS